MAACFFYVANASFAPIVGQICSFIDTGDYDAAYEQAVSLWTSCSGGFYYQDGMVVAGVSEGKGFFTDGGSYLYYGDLNGSVSNGSGCELGSYGDGYYRVNGTFAEGYANGNCEAYYSAYPETNGKTYKKTISGNYTYGYEDGDMSVIVQGKKKTHQYAYTAVQGAYGVIAEAEGQYIYADDGELALYKVSPEELENNGVPHRAAK